MARAMENGTLSQERTWKGLQVHLDPKERSQVLLHVFSKTSHSADALEDLAKQFGVKYKVKVHTCLCHCYYIIKLLNIASFVNHWPRRYLSD